METLVTSEHLLLVLGSGILAVVLTGIILPSILPTPRGELNRRYRELRRQRYALRAAEKAATRSRRKFEKMARRAKSVAPNALNEAKALAADKQILLGHAKDRVMAAENRTRQVILEEFPPVRQEGLLKRFVPEETSRKMPFTF